MASPTDDVCEENSHRAFQNEYIVEHLFSFLSVNDIKNCRLANRMFMKIGTKILRRRTHVSFDFIRGAWLGLTPNPRKKEDIFLEINNRMKEVRDYCKENTPENTPISSFLFRGRFTYCDVIKYLDDVRNYLAELKLLGAIYNEDEEFEGDKMTIDISPRIPPHLRKLHIQLYGPTNVTISLSFDQISFVRDINLNNCTIVLDGNGKRLSPNEITLGPGNKYIKNGIKVNKFLVNKSFDLTMTKQIRLDDESLILDFFDCANDQVERTVTLKNITVRNWQMCNWKIKRFSLKGIPFLDKNSIKMEELTTSNLEIDLSKIYNPTSLLKLYCYGNTRINNSLLVLPNLVDVTLVGENCVAKLPYFKENKNISKMSLEIVEDVALSVNINDFPKGINELRLRRVGVHGEGVCQLQTLIMEDYEPISNFLTFAAKFRSQTLHVHTRIRTDEEIQIVIQLMNLSDSYSRLVVGFFNWVATNGFNNSGISNYVDKEAEYYDFEGGRGKGLTAEEADLDVINYTDRDMH